MSRGAPSGRGSVHRGVTVVRALVALAVGVVTLGTATSCLVSFPDYGVGAAHGAGGTAGTVGAGTGGQIGLSRDGGNAASGSANGDASSEGAPRPNGGGSSIDSGGPDVNAASCTDGVENQDETDTDCGGSVCPACAVGAHCKTPTDCTVGFCIGAV
ncbi:MAG TPA: hypothetical protein VH142_13390, partial [Polyangiaceae bacterium]|nr:hypothetical protein [Polyangiaceae bacterium]